MLMDSRDISVRSVRKSGMQFNMMSKCRPLVDGLIKGCSPGLLTGVCRLMETQNGTSGVY